MKNLVKVGTREDLEKALKSEYASETALSLIIGAIMGYHDKLEEAFKLVGIDIGEFIS